MLPYTVKINFEVKIQCLALHLGPDIETQVECLNVSLNVTSEKAVFQKCMLQANACGHHTAHCAIQCPIAKCFITVSSLCSSPERIQSWTAVTWVQRVPESVCVAYKPYTHFTVKEEQVYVPSGIRDALEGIKWPHGLEEVVALRNLCTLGTSGKRVKGQWVFPAYCNHCKQVGGI